MNDSVPALHRIAVIKPCCIGDCVMALPALDALRRGFPATDIDLYVGNHSRPVFDARDSDERILLCNDAFGPADAARFAWRLRRGTYDSIFVLDRSRLLYHAARTATRGEAFAARSCVPEPRHETEVYLDAVRQAGISSPSTLPNITVHRSDANPRFRIDRPYAVLHPGGGSNPGSQMPGKRWSEDRWIALASALQARDMHIVLTGSADEAKIAQRIVSRLNANTTAVAGELSISESIDVVKGAAMFVGPDTGLTHVSAALGVPTVAIFGPTNPNRYRPLGMHVEICAAPGSWTIPDRDLRQPGVPFPNARVELVDVVEVVAACDRLLAVHR